MVAKSDEAGKKRGKKTLISHSLGRPARVVPLCTKAAGLVLECSLSGNDEKILVDFAVFCCCFSVLSGSLTVKKKGSEHFRSRKIGTGLETTMPKVHVAVRCRPCLPHETDLRTGRVECNEVNRTVRIASSTDATSDKVFTFDNVLSESATQQDVFNLVSPLINHVLAGVHATVFAYGQTGSGKTFTMEGVDYAVNADGKVRAVQPGSGGGSSHADHHGGKIREGLIPRIIAALFDRAKQRMQREETIRYRISCSFMQLYNERVSDLLNPPRDSQTIREGLRLKWKENSFVVENLFSYQCDHADQVRDFFFEGLRNKQMGSHMMNAQSSRSHCLFKLHVHSWDTGNPLCVTKSELCLVDLAGSEKLHQMSADPSAQLVKESIDINTSLLALGKVITALASKTRTHVPYRDSKLTKLLQHALGGNAMTMMIACINPLDNFSEESMSTLLYAGRARHITNEPRINEDPRALLIRQLREEIASLKLELEQYKQMLFGEGDGKGIMMDGGSTTHPSKVWSQRLGPPAGAAPSSSSPRGSGGSEHEEILLEKLTAYCRLVQNVMKVNSQLRDAFDKIAEAKKLSDAREVELNAENLNLRERIEVLEAIVLSPAAGGGAAPSPNRDRVVMGVGSSKGGGAPSNSSTTGMGGSLPDRAQPSLLPSTSSSLKGPSTTTNPPRNGSHLSMGGRPASNDPYPSGPAPSISLDRNLTDGFNIYQVPEFQRRLGEYTQKYREDHTRKRYEDYYPEARSSIAADDRAKKNMSVAEVEALIRRLPSGQAAAAAAEMVPLSLQSSHAYGSLSFGGRQGEVNELEERRRLRQQRMQQLQEQHMRLQQGVAAMLGDSSGAPDVSAPGSRHGPPSAPGSSSSKHASVAAMSNRLGSSGGHRPSSSHSGHPPLGTTPPSLAASHSHGLMASRSGAYMGPPPQQPSRANVKASSSSFTNDAVGVGSGARLFSHVPEDDVSKYFTAEQLAVLRARPSKHGSEESVAALSTSAPKLGLSAHPRSQSQTDARQASRVLPRPVAW